MSTLLLVNLIGCVVAVVLFVQTQHDYKVSQSFAGVPPRIYEVGAAAFVFLIAFLLSGIVLKKGAVSQPPSGFLRTLSAAVIIGATICGSQIVVGAIATGSYDVQSLGPSVLPEFDAPLQAGFWTFDFVQSPASDLPLAVSCGNSNTCVTFGFGYFDSTETQFPEATITTNDGRTWKSRFFSPGIEEPFESTVSALVCSGSVCLGPTSVGDTFDVMTIAPDGTPSVVLTHRQDVQRLDNQSFSCPTSSWCAGIDLGDVTYGEPAHAPGIITTSNGGRSWTEFPLPTSIVPAGDDIQYGVLSCPSISRCVMDGTLGLQGAQVSARAREFNGTLFLAFTTGGGKTWSKSSTPAMVASLTDLTCVSVTRCLAFEPTSSTQPGSLLPTEMIESTDGGAVWTKKSTNLNLTGQSAFRNLACGDPEHCVLVAGDEQLLRSSDGGAEWTTGTVTPLEPGDAVSAFAVDCGSADFCVATGMESNRSPLQTPVIIVTHDGGSSWTSEPIPVPQSAP